MFYIYKEGQGIFPGVGIGWVRGPVINYKRINYKQNTAKTYRFRIRFIEGKLSYIWVKSASEDYELDTVRSYINRNDLMVITRERALQFGLPSKFYGI